MATQEDTAAHDADFADEFSKPNEAPRQVSDDEAFGLTEPPAAAADGAPAEGAAASGAEAGAAPGEGAAPAAAAEAEPGATSADAEQRLKSWEGRLKARQAELDAREAAMGSSSVNAEQDAVPQDGEGASEAAEGEAGAGGDDPAAVLAADFGADFVDQITKLIKKIAGESVGGVSAQVDQVIADLQNERLQNHFNAIAGTHGDFMEVVESPDFAAWKGDQPDQDRLQTVIDSGSARQIIDMLTAFKNASKRADNPDFEGNALRDDDALDAAEGVRSSGISLPKEPTASDDFAKAWNEA